MLAAQVTTVILTFSMHPITLFDGTAKFLLFTVLPAAFGGAAVVFLGLGILVFHRGLHRYESGSALQIQSQKIERG